VVVAGVQVGLQRLGGKGMIGVVVPWLAWSICGWGTGYDRGKEKEKGNPGDYACNRKPENQ